MLSSLIEVPEPTNSSVEDILSSSVAIVFPDETRNIHGDAGSHVIYKSRRFGDIRLELVDPQSEGGRKLFAHYVWNAGVLLAELISGLAASNSTGVAGITSILAGASRTVISDYPAPEILTTLRSNVENNVPPTKLNPATVQGHEWGVLTDDFSVANEKQFSIILCADCLWVMGEHHSLVRSMLHFLPESANARVWIVAGFHTGRAALASFFDVATEEGLKVEEIWERDVDGNEREWLKIRDGGRENVTERKRWLVVAILRRPTASCSCSTISDYG